MFMFVSPDGTALYGDEKGRAQYGLQIFLVLVALVCIFWMLLSKPYILYQRSKNKHFSGVCFKLVSGLSVNQCIVIMCICFKISSEIINQLFTQNL